MLCSLFMSVFPIKLSLFTCIIPDRVKYGTVLDAKPILTLREETFMTTRCHNLQFWNHIIHGIFNMPSLGRCNMTVEKETEYAIAVRLEYYAMDMSSELFYIKLRLSSILKKCRNLWRQIHSHLMKTRGQEMCNHSRNCKHAVDRSSTTDVEEELISK